MDGHAMSVAELEAEILDVATALGVVSAGRLNGQFFENPPSCLRTILQSAQQRAALLDALDRLMTADGSIVDGTTTITRHPLVHNAAGTVAISIERSGAADDPTVVVGLWATAAQAQGYAVEVDLPLVQGVTAGLSVVAASAEHPLAVSASVPVGWDIASHPIGLQSASLNVLVVAADLGASRIALELTGLDVGAGPADLALDPANVESELAHVLISLLRAGLAAAPGADATVQALLDHLPSVLGIDGELPLLPLGQLASDAGAFRAWIGSLLTATVDGRPALVHWLDQLGQLLGAPALAATLADLPDISDPLQIPIVAGGDGAFALTILAYVAKPAASTTPELHVSISGGVGADVAAVRAEAELLVVPLGGNTAARALTMAQIVAESTGPLWPRSGATDDELRVGVARGGLRYDGTHVIPILELDDVFVALPAIVADPITFDRLDLTNAKTIAAEASQKVSDVLTAAIGANAVAEAVLGLIGLAAPTPAQLAAFANDPLRAIGALHRELLDAGTYQAMAQQIAALFGITAPITGSGTAADPWFAPLTGVAVTAGSTVGVGVAIWDVPGGGSHELHLGLRLATPPAARPGWSLSLAVDLLTISLPASAAAHAGLLGAITLEALVAPPAAAGAHVTADHLGLTAGWSPGSPLHVDASIAGVQVNVDGNAVSVGDITLPDGLTQELIDSAWDAVRAILDRAAAAWGQTAGAVVSALLGLGSGIGGLPASWPALTAPAGGIAALLADPLELLRARLAAIVTAADGDLGEVPLLSALELVSGLIGGRLPAAAQPALDPLPNGPPITGDGTYERPLALALTDPSTPLIAQPIDLIAWLEPGVPAAWAQAAEGVLGADSRLISTALGDLGSWLPEVSDALTGVPIGDPGPWLAALGAAVDGTDGLASAAIQAALPTGAIAADPVVAAHHLAPQSADAVAAVAAQLQANAAGKPIVLLAPSFAAPDVWSPLLTKLGVASTATVDLDVPGVSPDAVDLGAVTKADAYIVQLADDGTATLAVLVARLQRVVARIQTLAGSTTSSTGIPSVTVSLVGHSTAGLVAIQYAAARAADCQAIATIAAPLTPIDPTRTLTGDMASGVRLLRALAPAGLTPTPALDAALGHLQTALDGCVDGAPAPYPVAAFARALPTGASVGTIPTLVVPAVLESTVADGLAGALAARLTTQMAAAATPTHLCWGLRAGLALGTAAGGSGPAVDVHARLDLGRVALTKGAADPPAPRQRIAISATVLDPSGWLVGSGGTGTALDARLRAAEITFTATPGAAPSFDVTLYDAAVRGIGGPRLSLADVQAPELLNGLAGALAKAAAGTPAVSLLQALEAIGLASFDSVAQTAAFYADAISAVRADPAAFLRDRLVAALDAIAPALGLTADAASAAGPRTWRQALGSLPLELVVQANPAAVAIHTKTPLIVDGASFGVDATLPLAGAGAPSIDATLTVAGVTVTYDSAAATLTVAAPPVLPSLTLAPARSGSAVGDELLAALARTGIAAAFSAALEDALGGAVAVGPLAGLFVDPAGWLSEARRLGAAGGGLDADRITALVHALASELGVPVATDDSISIATGLTIAVGAGTTAGEVDLTLTAADLALGDGFLLSATLGVGIAPVATGRAITPTGTAALTVPLPGSWGTVTVTAGETASGASLAVTPGGGSPVTLLPTFGGLWDLIGGGVQALLPGVLNALLDKLQTVTTSPLLDDALAVADALGLRTGTPPTFDSAKLVAFVDAIETAPLAVDGGQLGAVITALLPAGAPVSVTGAGPELTIAVSALPVPGTASLAASNLAGPGAPTIGIDFSGLTLGPVVLDLAIADQGAAFGVTAAGAVALPAAVTDTLGFAFAPSLQIRAGAGPLTITLSPLGDGNVPQVELAPTPGVARADLGALLTGWAVPIVARIALAAASAEIDTPLWSSGPSARTLLTDAHLIDDTAGGLVVHQPLPQPLALVQALLDALGALRIPVTPQLGIGVYSEGSRVGIGATGSIDIPVGDFVFSPLLGSPDISSWTAPTPGLGVLLFDLATDDLSLGVRLGGVGAKLARQSGPLVDTSEVTVGAISAMTQTALELTGGAVAATSVHAGVRIGQLALPLGGSTSADNPVANSLLSPSSSSGSATGASSSGDDKPANPPADLLVASGGSGGLIVEINGKDARQPLYVDIERTFGPLHIDRIGLVHKVSGNDDLVGALVDGGVAVAGLAVEVQGLELDVPLHYPADLSQWQVDLSGLAVSFAEGPVTIAGGLLKTEPAGGVEYDGELTVNVGSFGLTALGGYSRTSAPDPFTSLFAFVVVNAPIGGPPYMFITGLAGGAGYNRQLVVPSDPAQAPKFPLLAVMDPSSNIKPTAANPMGPLHQMSAAMPARRGSYWVAAGLTFTTFELLKTRALAYVALDRGFQVGLIGLMDMALPTASTPIVSVELALSASYSSADELLAIRAQLTNNSWLISHDCQLTGGFAFYAWFGDDAQVLLTIGGYGPHWITAPGDPHASQYPVVPPVGFHWAVGDGIVVKGETYFALTPHQLAFGGRLEASYDVSPIKIWFTVYLDVDFQWDPLQYHADAGVSIGASFHFTVDLFIGSITINVSISLSATIEIEGPPLHGSVTVDLDIAKVHVAFGPSADPAPYLDWPTFAAKYLALTGAPGSTSDTPTDSAPGSGTSVATVTYGQLADSTKGAAGTSGATSAAGPSYGTAANPWPALPEFGFAVTAKAPLSSASFESAPVASSAFTGVFDVAPMGPSAAGFSATLQVRVDAWNPATLTASPATIVGAQPTAQYSNFPLSVWATSTPPSPDQSSGSVTSAPTMTRAMAGLGVAFIPAIAPAAAPPNIPIATLVEERPQKGLPFSTAPAPAPAASAPAAALAAAALAAPAPAVLSAQSRATASPRPTTPPPALRAMLGLDPAQPAVTVARGHGTPGHRGLHQAEHGGRRTRGFQSLGADVHVWRAGAGASIRGRGEDRLRVTLLSATGRVIEDHIDQAGQIALEPDPATMTVVVSGAPAAGAPIGWSLGSLVQQVGPGTAVGVGCTLLLSQPFTTAGRPVERQLRAGALAAAMPGLLTRLPRPVGTVVVMLDRIDATGADDLELAGADVSPHGDVRHGARRLLVCRVGGGRDATGPVLVGVSGSDTWRLAGVRGLAGRPRDWTARLTRDPARLPAVAPAAGDAAYRITQPTRRRSR
jgi:large repetitive protein